MCVCVLILISLFFLVSISLFLLILGLPLSFDLKSVICVVYVYKNPMPSSIIDAIMWTLQIIIDPLHHCRCHSRRTQVTTCFRSLTLSIFLFVTPFVYFMFLGQHHLSSVVDLCLFMFASHHRGSQWQWWCWWKRRWMTLTPHDALALKKVSIPNWTTKLYIEILKPNFTFNTK